MASPVVVSRIQNRRGTQTQFDSLYPPGYTGIGIVNQTSYPNVLQPGELALCTNSRRMFIGNINGEYIELAAVAVPTELVLEPLTVDLLPTAVWTVIPQLTYSPTPFFNIIYSVTDVVSPDWNTVGSTFARNGELKITAIAPPDATLVDSSTEINPNPTNLVFKAQYDITNTLIEILYMHDITIIPAAVSLSVSNIRWTPFI